MLLHPPEPLGRVEHWTWAARQAGATYCKLLLSGDRLPPDYVGTIRRAFVAKPDLIYTPFIILEPGRTWEEVCGELFLRKAMTALTGAEYLKRCGTEFNLIGPLSAVTFRTDALQAALPFESAYGWTADWRLYSRMMFKGTAIRCEATYCIQDRTIARVSSSFRGVLSGIFEERAYRRELSGKAAASPMERWVEAAGPVASLVARQLLPPAMARSLIGAGRRIAGRN